MIAAPGDGKQRLPPSWWLPLHRIADPRLPPLLLLLLPGLVTSCCHPHPSPLHMSISLPPPSRHCPAACHHIRTLVGLFVSVDLGSEKALGRSDVGNKHLKGGGTQLSQMWRNRHSISPSEARVPKARGLLFVFFPPRHSE
ncbi:hypothetical protein CesoFtcFv8_026201 [Champsocephalus esox]|uniref:Uncharacterized protein n=1 Tax=Champsocephalus esox TaxID=159716 RepID=A0AAN8B1V9_9TELE|nr:hypothetical protein CesoFtcFv8_026201 [Champsocephalus esox]